MFQDDDHPDTKLADWTAFKKRFFTLPHGRGD